MSKQDKKELARDRERRAEVRKLAADNYRLVLAYIARNWRRFPSRVNLRSSLSFPYMKAIDSYVSKRPSIKISTYVWRSFNWHLKKVWDEYHAVRAPYSTSHAAIVARSTVHFSGEERECEDSALQVFDDTSRLERIEVANVLNRLLRSLDKRDAEVVKLREIDGLTLKQVAERFFVTPERIRTIQVRALRKLRSMCDYSELSSVLGQLTEEEREAIQEEKFKRRCGLLPTRSGEDCPPKRPLTALPVPLAMEYIRIRRPG